MIDVLITVDTGQWMYIHMMIAIYPSKVRNIHGDLRLQFFWWNLIGLFLIRFFLLGANSAGPVQGGEDP